MAGWVSQTVRSGVSLNECNSFPEAQYLTPSMFSKCVVASVGLTFLKYRSNSSGLVNQSG